ncbi:MAG: TrpR-like protein, YerC/YecD [Clostridia bacterium]|nr:TrpR-like protein, YerC/YecD [Clostridia bacterium]
MKEKMKDEKIDLLFQGILSLQTVEECYDFFEDLCTVPEIQEMSRRLYAAKLLSENCIYTDIAERTGLSTATISRVNRCLKYGADGYTTVLARMKGEDAEEKE